MIRLSRHRSCVWNILTFIIFLAADLASAHSMKQVRAELSVREGSWHASVWLEGWALYPEDGPKIPQGTPGDANTAGRQWLSTLNPDDHATMRDTAAEFLKETFLLTLGNTPLEPSFEFPDYSIELPQLPENDQGNVVMRIDLRGSIPPGSQGPLRLAWADDEDEPLALMLAILQKDALPFHQLLRIQPGTNPTPLLIVQDDGSLRPVNTHTSLISWIIAGFLHILPKGADHICFILGLFFLQPKLKPLLWQTSAFTIAHSITLALAVLSIIAVPSSIVEPMIALSIAYVGIENLWVRELKPWRVALVFGLGLLHGMGFASVMQELDLPQGEVLAPLVGFNLGVELGQITVLAATFALTWHLMKSRHFPLVRKCASLAIGGIGIYWTITRIMP